MSLNVVSLNVQGFNFPIKRTKAVKFFHSIHAEVICLQETHFPLHLAPKKFAPDTPGWEVQGILGGFLQKPGI